MREQSFLILTALAGGPAHGYRVMQQALDLSDGRVRLRPGTLYTALDRLVGDGLVAVDGEEVVDGRNRRYYAITPAGRDALAEHAERWAANVAVARRRLRVGVA